MERRGSGRAGSGRFSRTGWRPSPIPNVRHKKNGSPPPGSGSGLQRQRETPLGSLRGMVVSRLRPDSPATGHVVHADVFDVGMGNLPYKQYRVCPIVPRNGVAQTVEQGFCILVAHRLVS